MLKCIVQTPQSQVQCARRTRAGGASVAALASAILTLRGMGSFEILEHTGEIGILARGRTPSEVFAEAARGMFSFIVDLGAVEERDVRRVEVEATDLEALLVEWLNELTYRF